MSFTHTSASERQFLPPAVAVSTVAFALRPPAQTQIVHPSPDGGASPAMIRTPGADPHAGGSTTESRDTAVTLWIALVRRTRPPFADTWALPGGPIPWNEGLAETALRTLHSAVHRPPTQIEQLYSFGEPERSAQAQRLVTIAYWALYGEHALAQPPTLPQPHSATQPQRGERWDDAPRHRDSGPRDVTVVADPNVAWCSADQLPPLAFDHHEIVATALWRLRSKTEYSAVAHRFLGDRFTLAQLREVHEAVRGTRVDPANFRRQMLAQGQLVDTHTTTTGSGHRPARLYRFRDDPPAVAVDPHESPASQRTHS